MLIRIWRNFRLTFHACRLFDALPQRGIRFSQRSFSTFDFERARLFGIYMMIFTGALLSFQKSAHGVITLVAARFTRHRRQLFVGFPFYHHYIRPPRF